MDKENNHKYKYQDIFQFAEKSKKKGGSLGAVFSLIQEFSEFEDKIQACADAQEMAENKKKISSFLEHIDGMYDILFEMARGGIGQIRDQRNVLGEEVEDVEDIEDIEDIEEGEEALDVVEEAKSSSKTPIIMSVPMAPKM